MPVAPATPESIDRIPFLATVGIRIAEIGERHATMELEVGPRHLNYLGGLHGGVVATLVDTA